MGEKLHSHYDYGRWTCQRKAKKVDSNKDVLHPPQHTGDDAMQSGIAVVQELYRVALADQEEAIAQLVTPDMVWEILESFPHGGIYIALQRYLTKYLVQAPFPVREIGTMMTLLHACHVP
jgi:hypothetical protein